MASSVDLFVQIHNAVLDLQASQFQTYNRPIKALNRLLDHPDLADLNEKLTDALDLDSFLNESFATRGGMVGSAKLLWPDSSEKVLGYTLLLIKRFADDPDWMAKFAHTYYYTGRKIIGDIHALTGQLIIPFVRDYKAYVDAHGNAEPKLIKPLSKKVFVVHGHDDGAREAVARFLTSIGLSPIILHEQSNRGMTVIEKVEANSDVGFAVVILTPDDEVLVKGDKLESRVRQNVLLELGYFIGKLGRQKVCTLKRGELEIPSDFAGVVWETMDANSGWKLSLGRELQAAGYSIDWNNIMT